jgi:hypothetical protein
LNIARKHPKLKISNKESRLLSDFLTREEEELLEKYLPKYELPNSLRKYDPAILPQSLMPPFYKDFINYEINTWSSSAL